MKGLTLNQFKEIVEFSQKHHRFALYIRKEDRAKRKEEFPNLPDSHGFAIKYIDSCYDSRDQSIWSVSFRQGSWGVRFSANHFTALNLPLKKWKYTTLYDLCMAYLKGEFEPKKEFEINLD